MLINTVSELGQSGIPHGRQCDDTQRTRGHVFARIWTIRVVRKGSCVGNVGGKRAEDGKDIITPGMESIRLNGGESDQNT